MTHTSSAQPVHVILVRPLYSRNVGNVSRTMANMGAQRLIVIDAQCEIDFEARQGAAGAQTHLLELTQYANWSDFLSKEPNGIRIAFCAREKKESDDLEFSARLVRLRSDNNFASLPYYLIFGPEDHGLTNSDVDFANFICDLPTYGPYRSMNLSHAVLLALFIFKRDAASASDTRTIGLNDEPFYFPESVIHDWLHALGFEFGDRRTDVYKVLKRILLRNVSNPKELRILEAVLFQTVRKLKD